MLDSHLQQAEHGNLWSTAPGSAGTSVAAWNLIPRRHTLRYEVETDILRVCERAPMGDRTVKTLCLRYQYDELAPYQKELKHPHSYIERVDELTTQNYLRSQRFLN